MAGVQASIGALNDVVDAPLDAGRKPGKPIPRGVVSASEGAVVAVAGLALGTILAAPSGIGTLGILGAGAACGYAYDLRLSRTPWSWLPLALALPLVPLYAWLGATGGLPLALLGLVPAGILAGSGLSIANGLADLERDQGGGARSIAVRLGRPAARVAQAGLLASAIGIALGFGPGAILPTLFGAVIVALGIGLGWSGGPARRERAWELEAVGIAVVGAAWVAALAGAR